MAQEYKVYLVREQVQFRCTSSSIREGVDYGLDTAQGHRQLEASWQTLGRVTFLMLQSSLYMSNARGPSLAKRHV